jgi:hypothetical protein
MQELLKQLEVFGLSKSSEEALGPEITVVARRSRAQSTQASISAAKQTRLDSCVTRSQSVQSKEVQAGGEVMVK